MCKGCCFRAKNSEGVSDGLLCTVHKNKKGHLQAQTEDESPEAIDSERTADTTSDSALQIPYISRCRALLVGIGADEQMAGYSRHRTKFKSGGVEALVAELNKDTERLWDRNLGRDDR
jgi:asparagine synthetase B (glutamine-hydrolysing)